MQTDQISRRPTVRDDMKGSPRPASMICAAPARRSAISFAPANDESSASLAGSQIGGEFGAPAARATFQDVRVMQEAVEERGDRGGVAEEFAPVIDGPVGGQDRGRALVTPHDEFEQVFGARVRELPHAGNF